MVATGGPYETSAVEEVTLLCWNQAATHSLSMTVTVMASAVLMAMGRTPSLWEATIWQRAATLPIPKPPQSFASKVALVARTPMRATMNPMQPPTMGRVNTTLVSDALIKPHATMTPMPLWTTERVLPFDVVYIDEDGDGYGDTAIADWCPPLKVGLCSSQAIATTEMPRFTPMHQERVKASTTIATASLTPLSKCRHLVPRT